MPKKKGPIRTEAVVPMVIVVALVYSYFHFFFDRHLRAGMEFAATRVHGAEVNIASVETSVWRASFLLRGLQVTDKESPARNLFELGEVRFGMLWDALLRAKVVVEEASILDIRAYTQRRTPGFVLPPEPPSSGMLARVQDQVLQQTRKRLNDNFLGDLASVLGGTDPKEQLKNIQADLQSQARATALEAELKAKRTEWEKRIRELPKPKELQELKAKLKELKPSGKNPLEIAKNLQQARAVLAEGEQKVKQVLQAKTDLTGDVEAYTKAVADLKKLAEQDVADLQKRLQLPNIDPKEFSTQMLLSQLETRLVSLRKYVALARRYLPPKKTAEQKAADQAERVLPPKRGEGVTYQFPVTTGYPLFWLKKAAITSRIDQSDWAGNVAGTLLDFSTDPAVANKPFQVKLEGDFPKQQLLGLQLHAVADHRTETAKETLRVKADAFPAQNVMFSEREDFRFGLANAVGAASFDAELAGEGLKVGLQSRFQKPEFVLEMKNRQVQEIVSGALAGLPALTMAAKAGGTWDQLSFDIDSNLGSALSAGFQKQMQAKLAEAKGKLDAFVNEKLLPQQKKAQEALRALTDGPGALLSKQAGEMDGVLKEAQGSVNQSGGGGGGGLLKGLFK